jgi:hypothetical protein
MRGDNTIMKVDGMENVCPDVHEIHSIKPRGFDDGYGQWSMVHGEEGTRWRNN